MLCHFRRGNHRVKQVSVPAPVDQRTEPAVLQFQEFAGLVKFDLHFHFEFIEFEKSR